GVSGKEGVQLHPLEIRARLELMPAVDPGDLVESVPRVLRVQTGARAATLACAQAAHLRRIKRRDGQAAGGVILADVDLRELFVGDRTRQALGKAEAGHTKTGAGGNRRVLQTSVGNTKLAQETRREVGSQSDSGVARRIGTDCCCRESL